MSQMIDFTLPSCQPGRTLHAFRCVPEGEVRAVLQLSHGMVEFIDRYKPLAENLAARGILVTGNDHLGHGGSIRTKEDYGYFGEPDGNRALLEDLHAVTTLTKQLYPGVPYFLLGHSMGGRAVSVYLKDSIKAAALWAPADNTGLDGLEFLDHSAEGRQAIYDGAIQNGVLDLPKWGVTISADFVQQVADQDPTASLRTYNGPLLLAYTAGDAELLSQATIDLTRQAAAEHSGPLVDLTGQYEDATHNFTAASGKKIDDFSVRRRIESATAEFFEEYL